MDRNYAGGLRGFSLVLEHKQPAGLDLLWYENGQLMRKIKFKDGLKHGGEDGTLGA